MKNLREDAEEYCTNGLQKRAMLRQFNSVEFPPLFVHPDQEEKLVSEIYPPPQLPEAQNPKTFRMATLYAQKLSGRSA